MELPPYTLPTLKGITIHMWERAKGFILKAGSIIFVANLILWTLRSFSLSGAFVGDEISSSILAQFGQYLSILFKPLGFGNNWAAAIASITGLVAKEVVVSTFATIGSVTPIEFTQVTAFAFIIFTMFAAPCFAAIGAMKRELNNRKLTLFAIAFQTGTAYILAMLVNIFGNIIFAGTYATQTIVLNYDKLKAFDDAKEDAIINGSIYGYVVLVFLAISLMFIVYKQFISSKK